MEVALKNNSRYRKGYVLGIVLFLIAMEVFFFRNIIGDALISDKYDGRLTMLITDYWYQLVTGNVQWGELDFFYPALNTLAYSDMFLGMGIIHGIFRLCGMSIYRSFELTIIVIHVIGTFSMYYLMKEIYRVELFWSLIAVMLFSFSSTYSFFLVHPQLISLSLIPVLAIFLTRFFLRIEDVHRKKRIAYGLLFITGFCIMMYTAWYTAFFIALFCLVYGLTYVAFSVYHKEFSDFIGYVRKIGIEIVIYITYAVLLLIPFFMLYLPVYRNTTERPYHETAKYLPELADIMNVSSSNLVLGKLIARSGLENRGYSFEVGIGFSLVLLFLFLIALFQSIRTKDFRIRVLAVSILICLILPIRLSANGISLWQLVYLAIPGAKSIRAAGRLWLFLSFPISVFIGVLLNKKRLRSYSVSHISRIILIVLVFLFNVRKGGVFSAWSESAQTSFIEQINAPPMDCTVFFIYDEDGIPDGQDENLYTIQKQVDAEEIANYFDINTINGYSGLTPGGWDGVFNVYGDSYLDSVKSWMKQNNLNQIYKYNISRNIWSVFPDD